MFYLFLRIYSLHLILFRVTLQHDPDLLFNPAKNAIYAGGVIRLKSGYSECWLDLKRKRYPGRYPDGGVCGRRYIGGCTPVYPDKINPYLVKDLTTLDDFVLYEPDGPLFEVVPPGQEDNELNTGFDDQFFLNNSVIQLVMDKANVERLEVTNFRAPVQKSLYQISSQYDETFLRKEADWRIILIQDSSQNSTHGNEDIWRPGHKFQLFNVEMQAYLGVTGNLMPNYLDTNLKEIGGYPAANMTNSDYIKTVWTVDKIRMRVDYETIHENTGFRKFYGDGRDPDTLPNNLILSFEDIQVCFAKELDVIKEILNSEGKNNFIKLLSEYKIELDTIIQSDMSHPVDIFNLYKRVSIFWKEVHQTYNNDDTRKVLDSFLEKFHKEWIYYGRMSAVGLLNIQMYHDLDPQDIINGIIYYGDKTYKSKSKLAIDDVKLIANAAKQGGKLNLYVRWLQSVPELHNEYLIAAADHDDALANWEHTLTNGIRTLTYPIHNNASEAAKSFREMFEQQMNMVCENPKITHTCKYQFQFEKIQQLCKEPGHSSAPRPENICSHINYQDPYLKLGPFRLEHLNTEPAVEVFHNIIYDDEIKWIKDMSRGYMATAQLTSLSLEQVDDPGSLRAKQAYFATNGQLKILTNRLELATTMKIHSPNYRFDSENYQVVNFGMGGITEIHLDEPALPNIDAFNLGGGFAATNILYISNNVAGGKTVFPDAGVGVYPEAGAMIYFSSKTTTMNADYRMSHLGCPAAYGNKFITNQLVRIVENMNRLPCYADLNNKLYPPNHYHITYDNILYQKDILTS